MNRDKRDEQRYYDAKAAEVSAIIEKAKFCPKCGVDCGEPQVEPDDPSVGIFGMGIYNACPEHGEFGYDEFGGMVWYDEKGNEIKED